MRVKVARCPECGADVQFRSASSVLCVCSYCRSALARTDVDVEKIGKVGLLADVPSLLSLGMRGSAYGGFTIVGRLQLDFGAGTWNEWYLALEGGRWLWLAETQGRYYLTTPVGPVRSAPPLSELHLGHSVHVPGPDGGDLVMYVAEVHQARIVSAEGELPWRVDPNEGLSYADLSGPRRTFGTLDYGTEPAGPPTGYVGREVELAELQLVGGSGPEPERARLPATRAARMECPSCRGALALRAPDSTLRVVCPFCASLVDVSQEPLRALTTLARDRTITPRFALGSQAQLRGTPYRVLGLLRRQIEGSSFFWDEYVLAVGQDGRGGFHYLIESDGHFTLVRPAHLGDVHGSGSTRRYEGHTFHRVEQVRTTVTYLDGEFPWEVEVGEATLVEDFWAPGYLLSLERSLGPHAELVASLGEYLDAHELFAAFSLKESPPRPTYIAPHQPNPYRKGYEHRKHLFWRAIVPLAVLMVVFALRNAIMSTRIRFDLSTAAGAEPAAEHIFLSEPFALGKLSRAAVSFRLSAPTLENSWLDVDAALINDEDGTAYQFGAGVSYYAGVEDGEAWSEGSRSAEVILPSVPAGRYVLRVEPSWPVSRPCSFNSECGPLGSCQDGQCLRSCSASHPSCGPGETCLGDRCVLQALPYTIELYHGATRWRWGLFFGLLMLAAPLVSWLRMHHFEQRRQEDMVG
ncbi:MAG: DUF4178 domain-containing protein [Myxococcales bacterium]|nr:DUF4178 domain-containing protein [Myxococcota bacterium]MDW8282687.1 DUF4178 domain-containing protein [Myxococcales bacterium]